MFDFKNDRRKITRDVHLGYDDSARGELAVHFVCLVSGEKFGTNVQARLTINIDIFVKPGKIAKFRLVEGGGYRVDRILEINKGSVFL